MESTRSDSTSRRDLQAATTAGPASASSPSAPQSPPPRGTPSAGDPGVGDSHHPGGELPSIDTSAAVSASMPGRNGGRWSMLLFNVVLPLICLAAAVGVVWLLGSVQPAPRPVPGDDRAARMELLPSVTVAQAKSLQQLGAELELTVDGTVVPYREVVIATEVAGRIIEKAEICETGSVVQAGDLLMRIDPTDYELDRDRLIKQKEQAYQALRELEQETVNTQRLLKLADEDIEIQERELARRKSLPSGFASKAEIDAAQRSVLQSRQSRLASQNQLELLEKRRASLQASEQLAETQLRVAEVNLERTEIRAPIDGVIVREDAELNTFVNRGSPIVTIEDTSKVEVASSLRMDQLYWISAQDAAADASGSLRSGYQLPETPAVIQYEISGRSGLVYRWEGRLIGYDGIGLDPTTRTVPVRILVDDPDRCTDTNGMEHAASGPTSLVRGMFVQVTLKLTPAQPLVVVPAKAIKPGNRVWHFIPDESVLEKSAAVDPARPDPAAAAAATTQPSASVAAGDGATGVPKPAFDADQWIAGRVVVVQPIVPIDKLSATNWKPPTDDGDARGKWWICEVPQASRDVSTISADSMLVVSPLGSIDADGLPARVRKSQLQNDVIARPAASDTITAANKNRPDSSTDAAGGVN